MAKAGAVALAPRRKRLTLFCMWMTNFFLASNSFEEDKKMHFRSIAKPLFSVLLAASLIGGASLVSAQTPAASAITRPPLGKQITITDAAGRAHVRSSRITFAQRKAAAQARVKALRAAAAKKGLSEVKK